MRALADYETSGLFTPIEKLVLRYTDCMTETPVNVPDDIFKGIQEHFAAPQVVELTSAIAWENYRARFNHAVGAESEGFSGVGYCAVPVTRETRRDAASRQSA